MTETETWKDLSKDLPDMDESQREAIRRAGAQRRHRQRVLKAQEEFDCAVDGAYVAGDKRIVCAVVAQAILRALAQVGAPGSRAGTAPPSWYVAHDYVDAHIAAMKEVLKPHLYLQDAETPPTISYDPPHVCVRDGDNTLVARFHVCRQYVLAEHVAAWEVERRASAVDQCLLHAYYYSKPDSLPALPDVALCRYLQRLRAARRLIVGRVIFEEDEKEFLAALAAEK